MSDKLVRVNCEPLRDVLHFLQHILIDSYHIPKGFKLVLAGDRYTYNGFYTNSIENPDKHMVTISLCNYDKDEASCGFPWTEYTNIQIDKSSNERPTFNDLVQALKVSCQQYLILLKENPTHPRSHSYDEPISYLDWYGWGLGITQIKLFIDLVAAFESIQELVPYDHKYNEVALLEYIE